MILAYIASLLTAFILGAVPIGFLIARWHGVDIRCHGSGNIGATNTARVLGKKAGVITLLGDMSKGVLAAYVPLVVAPRFVDAQLASESITTLCYWAGLAAIFGHCFSPFLHFRGGKGVATSFAVFLSLMPQPTLSAFGVFLGVFAATRIVSLSSIASALTLPLAAVLIDGYSGFKLLVPCIAAVLLIARHHTNIARLLKGTEPAMGRSKDSCDRQGSL